MAKRKKSVVTQTDTVTASEDVVMPMSTDEVVTEDTEVESDDFSVINFEGLTKSTEIHQDFQTESGHMLTGSSNPVSDVVLYDNGEIQIGGGVRYYRDGKTFAPGRRNTYRVQLDEAKDWNFLLVANLLSDVNGSRIDELYDVTFTVHAPNGQLALRLVWDEDTQSFHMPIGGTDLAITDGTTIQDGLALQEIQRLTFYTELLGELRKNDAGAPLGEFEFEYTAIRKVDTTPDGKQVQPVVARFKAVVTGPAAVEEPEEPEVPVVPETPKEEGPLTTSRFELYCTRMQLNVKQTPTSINENQRLLSSVINQTFRLPVDEFPAAWRALVKIVRRERTTVFSEYAIFRGFDRFTDSYTRERIMRLVNLLVASADVDDIRDAKNAVSFDLLINKGYINETELEYLNSVYDA